MARPSAQPLSTRPPADAVRDTRAFCEAMLPRVSRTFAICIRLLPGELEHPVLVSYLLCRVADTIEDATRLPPHRKVELLRHFRACLDAEGPPAAPLRAAFADPSSHDERLAEEADAVLGEFRRLPAAERDAIRPWVQEMCGGMAEFVERGSRAGGTADLDGLITVDELDRYCYFVAGTVGHLLTELFMRHQGPDERRHGRLRSLATSFGLGLQLTNIIKDVADDRRRGWSFVPRQLCQVVGIRPEELQLDHRREQARRVMDLLIGKARRHLLDALEYTTALPRRAYGIRLFCLTSLYFAVRTLRLAERDGRLLDPNHKLKISRGEVARTVVAARLCAPVNLLVRAYFRALAGPEWWGQRGGPMARPAAPNKV